MKKLFTGDKFFLFVTVTAACFEFISGLINVFAAPETVMGNVLQLAVVACIATLYISYKKHNKNLMKAMMGALLMAFVMIEVMSLSAMSRTSDMIATPCALVCAAVIFVNHMVINARRQASPANIVINQTAAALYALTYVVWMFTWIGECRTVWMVVSSVLYVVAIPCMMAAVVCIEARLDSYRSDREAAGWTEENGYPEGYIHEKDK